MALAFGANYPERGPLLYQSFQIFSLPIRLCDSIIYSIRVPGLVSVYLHPKSSILRGSVLRTGGLRAIAEFQETKLGGKSGHQMAVQGVTPLQPGIQ